MSIDQLICDLIVEDEFKANYTKRQRSIFCNNLHEKICVFLEEREKEMTEKLEEREKEMTEKLEKYENDLHETRKKLDKLKKSYVTLYRETDTYACVTLTYTLICLGFFCYVYYNFILCPYLTNEGA